MNRAHKLCAILMTSPPQGKSLIGTGTGPVGWVAAIEVWRQGLHVLVHDNESTVSIGTRVLCESKDSMHSSPCCEPMTLTR
jgi:hypothetical protein